MPAFRRVLAAMLIVAVGATAADAGRRRRKPVPDPPPKSGAEDHREAMAKKRRKEPEAETPEERRRRWERAVSSSDREDVLDALAELHGDQSADARDVLMAFVREQRDPRLKARGLLALGWRNNRGALELLRGKHGATSRRGGVAAAACRAIGAVGDVRQRTFLVDRLTDGDGETAAGALAGIVALDPAWDGLAALLTRCGGDRRDELRAESATALGGVPVGDWRERLTALCSDAAAPVRAAACEALGRRKDEASVALLMRIHAGDPDEPVRAAAKAALLAIDTALGGG